MPDDRIETTLAAELDRLTESGTRKGRETVLAGVIPASGGPAGAARVRATASRARATAIIYA